MNVQANTSAGGHFSLNFSEFRSLMLVQVYSVQGQLIFSQLIENKRRVTINSGFDRGIYLLSISDGTTTDIKNLIIN